MEESSRLEACISADRLREIVEKLASFRSRALGFRVGGDTGLADFVLVNHKLRSTPGQSRPSACGGMR